MVHNGIIENFRELREALEKKGAVFKTETDTEIVLHLVDGYLAKGVSRSRRSRRRCRSCAARSRSASFSQATPI